MVEIFATLIALFYILIVYRKLNNQYEEEKFRYSLHRLRTELRGYAIDKQVDVNSKAFDFLDYSICKMIQESYLISVFYLIALEKKHQNESDIEQYKTAYNSIVTEINKNKHLQSVNDKRNAYFAEYVKNQNKITYFIIKRILFFVISFTLVKRKFNNRITTANYFPEISGISF